MAQMCVCGHDFFQHYAPADDEHVARRCAAGCDCGDFAESIASPRPLAAACLIERERCAALMLAEIRDALVMDIAARFTCGEIDKLAECYAAFGDTEAATEILIAHAATDTETDDTHHALNLAFHDRTGR